LTAVAVHIASRPAVSEEKKPEERKTVSSRQLKRGSEA